MTTTVTINAHCQSSTTKVEVLKIKNNSGDTDYIKYLSDGDTHIDYVYGEQRIVVSEIPL